MNTCKTKCDHCGSTTECEQHGNNFYCQSCLNSGEICKLNPHNWVSEYGGFTHERGFWNYDRCTVCGLQTRNYNHGDFDDSDAAKEEAKQNN